MKKKKKKESNKIIKLFKHLILILIIGIMSFSAYEINKGYYMYKQAIEQVSIKEKIKEIKQKENYTKLEEVPEIYINAILAVEDHRFYEHKGVDIISITRAVLRNVKELKLIEGGSTITQQLAKNIYFTQEKKLERKCQSRVGKSCPNSRINVRTARSQLWSSRCASLYTLL